MAEPVLSGERVQQILIDHPKSAELCAGARATTHGTRLTRQQQMNKMSEISSPERKPVRRGGKEEPKRPASAQVRPAKPGTKAAVPSSAEGTKSRQAKVKAQQQQTVRLMQSSQANSRQCCASVRPDKQPSKLQRIEAQKEGGGRQTQEEDEVAIVTEKFASLNSECESGYDETPSECDIRDIAVGEDGGGLGGGGPDGGGTDRGGLTELDQETYTDEGRVSAETELEDDLPEDSIASTELQSEVFDSRLSRSSSYSRDIGQTALILTLPRPSSCSREGSRTLPRHLGAKSRASNGSSICRSSSSHSLASQASSSRTQTRKPANKVASPVTKRQPNRRLDEVVLTCSRGCGLKKQNDLIQDIMATRGSKGSRKKPLQLWEIQRTLGRGDFIEGVLNVDFRTGPETSFICAPVRLDRGDGHLNYSYSHSSLNNKF